MIHTLIETTTAARSTGLPTQHKLFRVPSGPFAGRVLALFARSPSELGLSYADPPFTNWLDPGSFVSESADLSFGAVIDDEANVYVAYTQQATEALRCVKLTFANGTWATQTPATVYDSETSSNKYASILKDDYGRIWVAWTRDDSGIYTLRTKSSVDDGQIFGGGPTEPGSDLSGATTSCYGLLVARANRINCLYTTGTTALKWRDRDLNAALWGEEQTLYTGTGLGADYGAAVSADAGLGSLFAADGCLFLKEYDGAVWGALQTVSNQAAASPSLRYIGTAPYALFLRTIGTDQAQLLESHRVGGVFSMSAAALSQSVPFATVLCHDADAPSPYADLTAAAADASGADVLHPTSGALLVAVGDAVYFGGDDRFAFVRILLSTPGTVGTVTWSFWNGSEWSLFVPDSGGYSFDQANAGIRLWPDGIGTPSNWQKTVVNGANRFWVRAAVAAAFATAPVGSQLTAVPRTTDVIPRR
ncbi:MAG TPA: hypothetical protein VM118_05370 [Acidobacteriota bacterium]|nr:hypothetical protein [Acidobacteriota bacterium]